MKQVLAGPSGKSFQPFLDSLRRASRHLNCTISCGSWNKDQESMAGSDTSTKLTRPWTEGGSMCETCSVVSH